MCVCVHACICMVTRMWTAIRVRSWRLSSPSLQWRQLGLLMDLDDEGRTVDLVEAGHLMKGQTVCCQEVFKLWLKGPDATWGNLIELLIDCELPLLNRLKMH